MFRSGSREENNSRPSAKNRPKSWNGHLSTQLTGHQADQSKRDRAVSCTVFFFCVCKIMSMRNYVTVTVGGARASHYCLVCTASESAKQTISLSMSRLLKGLLYNNSWWTGVDEATSTSLKGIQRAQPAPPVNLTTTIDLKLH